MSLTDFSLQAVRGETRGGKILPDGDLSSLGQEDLLKLRDRVDAMITETKFSEVNISKELLIQLKQAKLLAVETAEGSAPANQKAQVQNSLGKIITDLAKLQTATYTSERFKRLEGAVIRTVKTLPAPQQEEFFSAYIAEAELELL